MLAGQIKNEKIEQGRLHKVYTCTSFHQFNGGSIRERDGLNDGHFCSFSESYDIHVLLILLVENLFEGHNQIHLNILHDILLHILLIALRVIAPGFFSCGGGGGVQLFLYVFVCVFVLWDGAELNSCIR